MTSIGTQTRPVQQVAVNVPLDPYLSLKALAGLSLSHSVPQCATVCDNV
jgi:hypothetical protein